MKEAQVKKKYSYPEYHRKRYLENRELILEQQRKYYEQNKEKKRQYEINNKEKIRARRKNWEEKNKEKLNAYHKEYNSKPETKERNYKTYKKNLPKILERKRNRYKTDPNYLLMQRMRNRLKYYIRSNSGKRKHEYQEMFGCTVEQLKKHIENQFVDGMCWDRIKEIHIDHIVPLHMFDFTNEKHLLLVSHYTNLRPLWAKDNLSRTKKEYQEAMSKIQHIIIN